jgi:hypothetical protein
MGGDVLFDCDLHGGVTDGEAAADLPHVTRVI